MQVVTNFVFYKERTTASTAADMNPFVNVRGDILALEISGTAISFSVTLEGRANVNNDSAWYPISGIKLANLTKAATETEKGVYEFDIAGLQQVRANITSISGGNLTVFGRIVEGA